MKNRAPRVTLEPKHNVCRSHVQWDKEALILTISISYSESSDSGEVTLAKKIDKHFGIEDTDYRIILGDMDILLDSNQCIMSLEIRTNPASWQQLSLPLIPDNLDSVFPLFLVEYDENHIASYSISIQIMQDMSQQQLSFVFGDSISSQWVKIADGLVLGLTADLFFSELRLLDIDLAAIPA